MAIYEKKYKISDLKNRLAEAEKEGKTSLDIEELVYLIGWDLIDVYHFYVNNVRNRVRYKKEKRGGWK